MRPTVPQAGAALLAALALTSCATQKCSIRVENAGSAASTFSNPIIYSLPKTAVTVKVTAISELSVRGPYYQYAQKYLGTDDVISANSSRWMLGNVEISSYPAKDASRTFAVEASYPCSMSFSPEGFLESVNTKPDFAEQSYSRSFSRPSAESSDEAEQGRRFQEVNVNRYETVFDTILHVVDADSIFTTVPTAKKNVVRKSLDEQAQELANQIFVLRDDRNALLAGESDGKSIPTGDALKFMHEQLTKLEESYMSMFLGKKIRTEKTYVFEFWPSGSSSEQDVIFRFSPEYGVLPKSSQKGYPIDITVRDLGDNSSSTASSSNQESHGLAYLPCASALVRVMQGSSPIAEKVLNICQMAPVRYLPEKMTGSSDFKLILYPATGTIKSLN